MGKKKKRVFIGVGAFLAVALITAVIAFYPMLAMRPAETGAVANTSVYSIKNAAVSVYFIDSGEGVIMVDAGANAGALEDDMNHAGISAADVKWILLTHSDADHVAALPLFPEAQVYMSESELRAAASKSNFPIDTDGINSLTDGQEISLGGVTVKGISAPGHREGHTAYLIDGKYLFTGDAFGRRGAELFVHPFSDDESEALKTIELLQDIISGSEIIFTGHYGYYRTQ